MDIFDQEVLDRELIAQDDANYAIELANANLSSKEAQDYANRMTDRSDQARRAADRVRYSR